jgi:NADPH-dependent ferric siderophore reductase
MPEGERPHGRAYTIRHFDSETRKLAIDFVLHGDNGRASAWAARADVGDAFHISPVHPRSGFLVHPETRDYLLFGDETALSAIGGILEALPASARASAFIEVDNPSEEQSLRADAALAVTWLHRSGRTSGSGQRLEDAARAAKLPDGAKVWVAAESSIVSAIRKHVLLEPQSDRNGLHAVGYWKQGEADHRDDEAAA